MTTLVHWWHGWRCPVVVAALLTLTGVRSQAWEAGWYGFNCGGIRCDHDPELHERCADRYTRLPFRITGSSKTQLCAALGLVCVRGCSWLGNAVSCDQATGDGHGDGTHVAYCVQPSTTPTLRSSVIIPSSTPTPTPTATPLTCAGDCNRDGAVTIDELLRLVNVSLGISSTRTCSAGDADQDFGIAVDEVLMAVRGSLGSCVALPPPAVSGTVRLPNGIVAQAPPSVLQSLADLLAGPAVALTAPNVLSVGADVEVRLRRYGTSHVLGRALTDAEGRFRLTLSPDTDVGACPWLVVAVGTGRSLTRAFVTSADIPIDIDFNSEAVLRLIEAEVPMHASASPCTYTTDKIEDLVQQIRDDAGAIAGADVASVNREAARVANTLPIVRDLLEQPFR